MKSKKAASRNQRRRTLISVLLAAVVLVVAGFVLVQSFTRAPAADQSAAIALEVSVADAAKMRDSGAFVLDVRTPEEWAEFHIPDSTLITLDQLPSRLAEVPRGQPILVVCRSGNRSQAGRDILLNAGFTNVTSMAGGLRQWQAEGYPTVAGS